LQQTNNIAIYLIALENLSSFLYCLCNNTFSLNNKMHLHIRKSYSRKPKKVFTKIDFSLVKIAYSRKIFIIETIYSQKTFTKEILAKRKSFVNVFVILTIIITKIASKISIIYSRII